MNIFVTSKDPYLAAKYLDDKRVIKMALETSQLLATAINLSGGKATYKTTHINHPCSIWVRSSRSNYLWTLEHLKGLLLEYARRYDKAHKCGEYLSEFEAGATLIPELGLQDFVNCTSYKEEKDVTVAYQKYLADKWNLDKREPTWYGKY